MKKYFTLIVVYVLLIIMGVHTSNANTCLTGTEQIELFRTSLSNSDLPVVGETLFFDDFGESDLNNGNKGRTASLFMPLNGFEFGNSYLQLPTPGGNNWDDNPTRNAARINDGFYAVVAPAYIYDGWFIDDGWGSWWTDGWDGPNPIYDYSGTENGAALVINAGENLTPFYEREALIQGGATYRASFKLFVVQATVQVGIDIIDPVTQNVLYTMQTIEYVNDYNNDNIDEWQDVVIDFTMPGICSAKEVVVSFRNHFALVNGNDYYVDNISLEKIADAPACPPVEDCVSNGKTSVNLNDAYVGVIPDGVSLVWSSTSDRSSGLVTNSEKVTTNGTYYAFFYDADNDCYNTDVSTSSVEVFIVPPCIIAKDDINQTPINTPVDGDVLTNDKGEGLTVTQLGYYDDQGILQSIGLNNIATTVTVYTKGSNPVKTGYIDINPDGTYTFTPETGYIGNVSLHYTTTDAHGMTEEANLDIEVLPILSQDDHAPVAQNDVFYTKKNTPISNNALKNDSDPKDETIKVTTYGQEGDINNTFGSSIIVSGKDDNGDPVSNAGTFTMGEDGFYTFTPNSGFVGTVDPITYEIENEQGSKDTAKITITISPIQENNTFANDDANTAPKGETMNGNVLDNDFDPEDDPQTVTSIKVGSQEYPIDTNTPATVTIPGKGIIVVNEDGSYEWTPEPNFIGTVVVRYTPCDNGTPVACDNATLYLTNLDESVSLPIKLVSFDATKKDQVAVLDWITASEENNSGFDIERSVDGKNWNKIGFTVTQAENGNSSATLNYQFLDEQPMSGANFYRLKQVDFDGSFDYSIVRQLVFDHFKNAVLVYPNPAQDYVIVDGLNSKATIHVINAVGQEVLKQISESNTMKLQINQLPSGMYYIHVLQDGVEVQVEKIMITK